jgi:hypothetical protein
MWVCPHPEDADREPHPAVWNLDRALCDLVARRVEKELPGTAAAFDDYACSSWVLCPTDTLAAMHAGWMEVGARWPGIDPDLPVFVADLLAEYRRQNMDSRDLLRKVWAAERRLRGDPKVHGTPESPAGWRILADVLPALWI